MTAIYDLHEFNPDKIVTGEIVPDKVANMRYVQYARNDRGTLIIDKNTDVSVSRNFITLQTTKTPQDKFNQVVDVEFYEFVQKDTNAALTTLIARVSALEAELEKARASKSNDTQLIAALNAQILTLQEQISVMQETPPPVQPRPSAVKPVANIEAEISTSTME